MWRRRRINFNIEQGTARSTFRMKEILKLGIIGAGWPGQIHAQALRTKGEANLYGCADLDERRRTAFEKEYAPEKSFADYHELLQDRRVDAVVIRVPNSLHFLPSLAALEARTR